VLSVACVCAGIVACRRGLGAEWMQVASNKAGVIYLDTVRTRVMDGEHGIAILRYELTRPAPVMAHGNQHFAAAIESVERVDCASGIGQIEQVTSYDSAGFQLTQEQRDPPDQDDLGASKKAVCEFLARRWAAGGGGGA